MIVCQASHVAKHFAGHEVLRDASFVVQTGDRVALVGANGAGKTTLLRILVGEEICDTGEISLAKGATLGYQAQTADLTDDLTVFGFVAQTFRELYAWEATLRTLERQMAQPEVHSDDRRFAGLAAQYDQLRTRFEAAGGYAVESRIRRVLDGMRFPTDMHDRAVRDLSGGQKTRLSLARLLAWQPSLLVLDEPTNYLDTETLSWLESYLQGYEGAVLVVSHDRYFLDQMATAVCELADGRTTWYTGNYSAFVEQKSTRLEADLKRFEAEQQEIARLEQFVQKNIARASTTKRAQSRRKLLDRMIRMDAPAAHTPTLALSFTTRKLTGKDVLRVRDGVIGYADRPISGRLNFYLARGERVAIMGPNGIGKTTLLRTLMGALPPLGGHFDWGANVDLGYYDQEQSFLADDKTVLDQIWDEFPSLDKTTVRTALGRFLFRGEEVDKPVASLSGGERSRVSLCRLMLRQANVLVLDEPTNHLDLLSKEALEDALQDYDGTILFVSHDRYFIDALATQVLEVGPDGYTSYLGNYSEAQRKRGESATQSPVAGDAPRKQALASPADGSGDKSRPVRSADLRKLQARVQQLEASITAAEARMEAIQHDMVDAAQAQDFVRLSSLQQELDALDVQHATLLTDWERAASDLETMASS